MAATQVFARYRARRDQQQAAADERSARALRGQQRAIYQQARLGWVPALDPRWLDQVDLPQTARLGRRGALRRRRPGRQVGAAQLRGPAAPPAPLRHGALRPAPRRRAGTPAAAGHHPVHHDVLATFCL